MVEKKNADDHRQRRFMIDRFDRRLNYLRVSITDRCNLRCIYCTPREKIEKLAHEEILRYEEILRIIRIMVRLGVSKIRITGGEPLVRVGVAHFLREVSQVDGIKDISLTTNGMFVETFLQDILSAGIRRINVSLDTLKPDKYKTITGMEGFDKVWRGIEAAQAAGMHPIKINVVAIRGINDDELEAFARLSLDKPWHIRFIEHMPMGGAFLKDEDNLLLAPEIRKRIENLGELIPVNHEDNDGPADRYRFENGNGEIGFIRPLSRHFCHKCNRLRLTADGCLRTCLLSDDQENLKDPIRKGWSDEALTEIILKAVRKKPMKHTLQDEHPNRVRSRMFSIGG